MGHTERCVALEARKNRQNSVFPFFILLIRISVWWIEYIANERRYLILFVLYMYILLKICFI